MKKFSKLFKTHTDCLTNRILLKNLLNDFFKGDKLYTNIVIIAFDLGVIDEIQKAKSLDAMFWKRLILRLENEFGMNHTCAAKAIEFWAHEYAEEYLKREVDFEFEDEVEVEEVISPSIDVDLAVSKHERKKGNNKKFVNLDDFDKGEKLPKSLLQYDDNRAKSAGINTITATVFKDVFGLRVVGELNITPQNNNSMKLFIVIHNDKDEIIEFRDEFISINGNKPFDYSFDVGAAPLESELIKDVTLEFSYSMSK